MFNKSILLVVLYFLFMGCSVKGLSSLERDNKIQSLRKMLILLDTTVNPEEAFDLAKNSILYSEKLGKRYEVVSPPLWQNTLVNVGFKKRGLCYHWANDLKIFLKQRAYKSLVFYEVVARQGEYFEHNALAVSSLKAKGINNAILLDAWRNSGMLFFIKIDEDKKYSWKKRLK